MAATNCDTSPPAGRPNRVRGRASFVRAPLPPEGVSFACLPAGARAGCRSPHDENRHAQWTPQTKGDRHAKSVRRHNRRHPHTAPLRRERRVRRAPVATGGAGEGRGRPPRQAPRLRAIRPGADGARAYPRPQYRLRPGEHRLGGRLRLCRPREQGPGDTRVGIPPRLRHSP